VFKRIALYSACAFLVISLSGCATARKSGDEELQSLRNQVSLLESQLQSKDEEINSLRDSLDRVSYEAQKTIAKSDKMEVKCRPSTKDIQTALSAAGYDPGVIDGKMGRKTREAIKAFQKANNLNADGKVGKDTWDLLKKYLDKKMK